MKIGKKVEVTSLGIELEDDIPQPQDLIVDLQNVNIL